MAEAGGGISITLNGDTRELPAGLTVHGLLDHLEMGGKRVAVARNSEIVPKSDYGSVRIEAGDRIEIVHAIGGGTA